MRHVEVICLTGHPHEDRIQKEILARLSEFNDEDQVSITMHSHGDTLYIVMDGFR